MKRVFMYGIVAMTFLISPPLLQERALADDVKPAAAGTEAPAQTKTTSPDTKNVPVTEVEVTAEKEKKPKEGSVEAGYKVENVKNIGPWGEKNLQDTPYSINIMSKELLENLQVTSTNEVWKYNPYTFLYIPGARLGDNIYMRGVFANQRSTDGLRINPEFQPLEDKERIEVMTGVTGFMYGIGSPSGWVNYVTKRAPDKALADVTTGFSGRSETYIHGDFGGPLNANNSIGYRLNVVRDQGETYISGQNIDKYLVSGALDFHFNDRLKLELDASHYYSSQRGMQVGFSSDPTNPNFKMSSLDPNLIDPYKSTYGQPWSFEKDIYTQGGGLLTWKINDTFTFRSSLRFQDYYTERLNVNATMQWPLLTYTETIYHIFGSDSFGTSTYSYLDSSFHTGPVSHKVTMGMNFYRQSLRSPNPTSASLNIPGTFNVDNPANVNIPNYAGSNNDLKKYYISDTTNLIIGDDIKFTDQWSMLVGVNWAFLDTRSYNLATGATSSYYDKSKPTPAAALMFKPIPIVTTYVSYLEALEQGGTAPLTYNGLAVTNAGAMMQPFVDRQYEAGVKATLGKVLATAALFKIERANQYVNPGTLTYVQDGRLRYQGVEFTATGSPMEHLRLYGGVTFEEATTTKNQATPQLDGKWPVLVPNRLIKLYSEYDIPPVRGLTLTAGIFHTGTYFSDTYNTSKMPEANTGDIGVRYQTVVFSRPLTLRFNVANVTDERYWVGSEPGDPRTYKLSATISLF